MIKDIREAIEGVISALPDGFVKLQNKFDLTKNNSSNSSKRFGVLSKEGDNLDNISASSTINRNFEIILTERYLSTNQGDESQQNAYDVLEDAMYNTIIMLNHTRLGLEDEVINLVFTNNEEIDTETVENLAILRFNIIVTYVIRDYCTP